MAIYGAGSVWQNEEKEDFFKNGQYIIGWNYDTADDLYEAVSQLKVGDIIYLKSNRPGSKKIRVKGIGIVTSSFLQCFIDNDLKAKDIRDWNSFFVNVKWIIKDEFHIEIPKDNGKLTNVRAAAFYPEYSPFVQKGILNKIFTTLNPEV